MREQLPTLAARIDIAAPDHKEHALAAHAPARRAGAIDLSG